jgi:hypothetical protein
VVFLLSCDPESHAGGRVPIGRVLHAGQVKGDYPDRKESPGTPGEAVGRRIGNPNQ